MMTCPKCETGAAGNQSHCHCICGRRPLHATQTGENGDHDHVALASQRLSTPMYPGGFVRLCGPSQIAPDQKIAGYRTLSPSEISAINSVKALEADAAALVAQLRALKGVDHHYLAIGITNLQQAAMWLTKAIAQSDDPFM